MAGSKKQVTFVPNTSPTTANIKATINKGNQLAMKNTTPRTPTLKAPSAMRKGGRSK